ncbi:MAG: TPR repeat [Phormidesmis priestleyi Ana]|uniref:TPR repeat n=1 Tax=Phormidesmis priestleyi Ana TaxID=1666911 RepID=A0A0P7ZBN6_9CYAN|nr:MAG: TPR repeat [Phormidesmis priestleyi Ana]
MKQRRSSWLTRWVKRLLNWLSRVFSRPAQPVPPAAPPSVQSVEQSVTGDRNGAIITVGDNSQVTDSVTAPPPSGEINSFGVPYLRNRYFAGREVALSQIHQQLTQSGAAAITQVQAISGLGGIGKTQTAVEYAYRYHYDQPIYEKIFWVNADTEVILASDFAGIAEQVGLPGAQTLLQNDKIRAVRSWLSTHDAWLLIFDNADHPDWLPAWIPPNPKGKVLIISRASGFDQLGIETPIALDRLLESEALTLLFERTGIPRTPEAEAKAKVLNETLDGLPLALDQACAYIQRQQIGFGAYIRAYQNQGLTQLETEKARSGRYPSSVLKIWKLNIAAVTHKNSAATALLELSAFLAQDDIPDRILIAGTAHLDASLGDYLQGATQAHEPATEAHDEAVSLAIRELLLLLSQYSLVQWSAEPSTYRVHRLVQAVVRDQIKPSKVASWLVQATVAIADAYPGQDFKYWPQCRQLLPHWLWIVEQSQAIAHRSVALGFVCNQAGFFLASQGRYEEAEPLYVKALEIRKAELGERHPDTARSLDNLAGLYRSHGRYGEAEPLYIKALEIRKTELGERHPDTGLGLNNLAALYESQGRCAEAELLYIEALEISKTKLGDHNPATATGLNNLAALYKSQGRYVAAEPLYVEVLKIKKTELGEHHPDTTTSLNNLAALYESQGRYGEAEQLYVEALEIRKAELGDHHPDTTISLNNLAGLYRCQGRYGEAEPLYVEALEIWITELGERHPYTATVLSNLAALYESQGRYGEAEPLYGEALEIRKTELGDRHPDTATVVNNLAGLYRCQGRYGEAEPLYVKALEIRKAELSDRHPHIASSLFNLAALYHQTQRFKQAQDYIKQALAIYITILEHDHPTTRSAHSWLQAIEKSLAENSIED